MKLKEGLKDGTDHQLFLNLIIKFLNILTSCQKVCIKLTTNHKINYRT